ncbi:hypothetical protein RVY52_003792 [Burkholderia cenocepacia]|nr:hypothetical protein [Burkholderia cenocepacia]
MSVEDQLRLFWLKGITGGRGRRQLTTEKFIHPKYVTHSSAPTKGCVDLYVGKTSFSINFFSHEADRFASACFESLIFDDSHARIPKSLGWPLIKAYYSAFFATHALFRIHGWACTRILPQTTALLNKEASALYQDAAKIDGGLYFLTASNAGASLHLESMDSVKGGSHEALWAKLLPYLDELSSTVLTLGEESEETQDLIALIDRFAKFIEKKGGAVWFTQIRNRLNYSHDYGVWYPYENSTVDPKEIRGALNGWLKSPADNVPDISQSELNQFAVACAFMISLCRLTIEDLAFRSGRLSPFHGSSKKLVQLARST